MIPRTGWLQAAGLVLMGFWAMSCGPKVEQITPGLPGDGTDNLRYRAPEGGGDEADLWAGKELIPVPATSKPKALSLPEVTRFELNNGLKVLAVHDSSLPVVTLELLVRVGRRHGSRDKVGLAEFVATAMTRGTKKRNAQRIAQSIEEVGGSLGARASYEATMLSCKALSKDASTCLQLLPDIVANPSFPADELSLVRRNLLADVKQRFDDAGQLANAHFQAALWGSEHPRGWVVSERSIEAISRDDLVSWHRSWIRPNNAVLAVSGDFDATKLKAELERAFRGWKRGAVPKVTPLSPPALQGLQVRLVDKPNQSQSHIRFGHVGIPVTDPRFYAARVVNYILGGGQFSSRLLKTVRSKEGKAYTVTSTLDGGRESGVWAVGTFTRSRETMATVQLVRDVIGTLSEEGPSSEEVAKAASGLAGSYMTQLESAEDVASALLAAELSGLGERYVARYPAELAKVDLGKAKEVAHNLLEDQNAVLVIVGAASKVAPQLEKAGWSFETIPYTAPASDWERDQTSPTSQASEGERTAAKKLLQEALAAKGGAKLRKLKTFEWTGEALLRMGQGTMKAEVKKTFERPTKLRLDMKVDAGGGNVLNIATILADGKGWAVQGPQVQTFNAQEYAILSSQLWRDSELVLLRQLEEGVVIQPLGERTIAGKQLAVIAMQSKDGKSRVTLLIDKKSKLVAGLDYSDQGVKTEERFKNYKKVSGLQVAHERSMKNTQVDQTITLKNFKFNPKISATTFAEPTSP